jgi:hypothetical protein
MAQEVEAPMQGKAYDGPGVEGIARRTATVAARTAAVLSQIGDQLGEIITDGDVDAVTNERLVVIRRAVKTAAAQILDTNDEVI